VVCGLEEVRRLFGGEVAPVRHGAIRNQQRVPPRYGMAVPYGDRKL
jgi:hypothetical protein